MLGGISKSLRERGNLVDGVIRILESDPSCSIGSISTRESIERIKEID